ncbi:hypothetical protein CRE_25641 [Caenorhabditis remanei]|uniref:Uncharacterized protein n=1 Tax=Caenorhabditis remanei TaxID=31234 RepID=E3ML64_CAERE|nr:hypothetical protein CRE_25641 [Caenorhabditis remanei]
MKVEGEGESGEKGRTVLRPEGPGGNTSPRRRNGEPSSCCQEVEKKKDEGKGKSGEEGRTVLRPEGPGGNTSPRRRNGEPSSCSQAVSMKDDHGSHKKRVREAVRVEYSGSDSVKKTSKTTKVLGSHFGVMGVILELYGVILELWDVTYIIGKLKKR